MAGPMRKSEWIERFRRGARTGLRLSPWLLLTLLFVLILWQTEPTALAGLFQSPPTAEPTVPATGTSEVVPSQVPTATITPVLTSTPTVLPSDTPTVLPSDTPTVAPSESPTVNATQELPADEGVLTPAPTGEEGEGTIDRGPQRYAEGESDLNFDWGMLFDAAALGLSYVWLCCGVLIVLAFLLLFLVLWVASARRQRTEE
jgi:hypothetical protein